MAGVAASGSGVSNFLSPSFRLQSTDIQAALMWGVAATTTALWLIQGQQIITNWAPVSSITVRSGYYYLSLIIFVFTITTFLFLATNLNSLVAFGNTIPFPVIHVGGIIFDPAIV